MLGLQRKDLRWRDAAPGFLLREQAHHAGQGMKVLQPKVEAGVEYFIVHMPRIAYDPTPVERFAEEVVPKVER